MVIQARLYTADDLWEISHDAENAGKRFELIEGVLHEMSPAGWDHSDFTVELAAFIRAFVRQENLGRITAAETGFTLFKNPQGRDTVLAPDVGFIAASRIPEKRPAGYVPFAPDLAVEVVSPGNTADELSNKVELYLRYGTRMVWLVYPKDQAIHVYQPAGEAGKATVEFLSREDVLDGKDVLPGFALPVSELFAAAQG